MVRWVAVLSLIVAGCGAASSSSPAIPAATSQPVAATKPTTVPAVIAPPYLLHLPGIGGERRVDRNMVKGLEKGGYSGQVFIDDWTEGRPGIPALRNADEHAREAQLVADKITQVRRADPHRRIVVIGHSGGTGLAVEALKRLPPDVKVNQLILLASALSPTYDLSPALAHVQGEADNFVSRFDIAILGFGTWAFGTFDGVHTPAAGLIGFKQPAAADPAQYAKLREKVYDPAWQAFGNTGQHIGPLSEMFAEFVLAPMVLGPSPALRVLPPSTQPGSNVHERANNKGSL